MDTLQIIIALAAKQFGREPDSIDPDARVAELGIDSLDLLELLFEVEDEIGVPIPPESVRDAGTLRELASAIDTLIGAHGQQPT